MVFGQWCLPPLPTSCRCKSSRRREKIGSASDNYEQERIFPRGFYVWTDNIWDDNAWSDPVYFDNPGFDQDVCKLQHCSHCNADRTSCSGTTMGRSISQLQCALPGETQIQSRKILEFTSPRSTSLLEEPSQPRK